MSEKKPHFIPHPLCQHDPKVPRTDLDNLDKYLLEASNPRWAASFLIKVIASGLRATDYKAYMSLAKIADDLAHGGRANDFYDYVDKILNVKIDLSLLRSV